MKTSAILSLFVAIPLVSAVNITVSVGKDETTGKKGLGFAPSYIYPNIGDLILFEFESGSHSVVESSFTTPCTPNGRFDSRVQTVPDSTDIGAPGLPTVDYYVNSTDTLWFSDQAGNNCKEGAVFVVNPTAAQTAAQFKVNAMATALPTNTTSSPHHNSSTSIQTPSGLGITAVICRSFCTDVCDKKCFYVDLSQKYPDGST
ncbi:hypothetical protein EV421DRAFT_158372 [Armillaria borealis]|uniref:Phytocyanin domain-containing protein n=1 Tax=Armillaria borealis TaxID=47425 RepID=A0AA39JS41_9AGAR|nr:hypothetical protein EV421DRAFT_158372 [Armillaria borealis]